MKYFIYIILLFVIGCTGPIKEFDLSSEVKMILYKAEIQEKGFEVKVKFVKKTGEYEAVIQEVFVPSQNIKLVETFKPSLFGKDVHFSQGEDGKFKQYRFMKVYLGDIEGADWDHFNFAHLPQNKSGLVKTSISKNWNTRYTSSHKTRGRVIRQSSVSGNWDIEYDGIKRILIIKCNGENFKVKD
jgi:hypothetical protein